MKDIKLMDEKTNELYQKNLGYEKEIAKLKAENDELVNALIWCSGSQDFQVEGKARVGWEKICTPLIKQARGKK